MTKKLFIFAAFVFFAVLPAQAKKQQEPAVPKYVFYMIGDGMGINQVRGAEIFNEATGLGPSEINFFHFPVRTFINTHSSSSLVTDSAAGGTALSSGFRTYNDGMGVDPDGKVLSNITEWAHERGFGAGVATSVGVNHATPAAFYAHTKSRSEYEKIAEQLIAAENIDFAAGAGFLNEAKKTGHDSQYLEQKAKDAGIAVLHGKSQFNNLAELDSRLICLSANPAETDLKYAIDQKEGDTYLAEFVEAGIDYLYGHYAEKGFFFMVEGGKIDYAGHNDDGSTNFMEVNDFARAIDVVLAFYIQHPDETLIVVTADHETGGLILGAGPYEMSAELIKVQNANENVLTAKFSELAKGGETPSWETVRDFFKENLGLWDSIPVSARQEEAFKDMYARLLMHDSEEQVRTLYSVNSRIVSEAIDYANKQAGYHWAHGSHSGSPVGLYIMGVGATSFLDCQNNVDVPVKIAEIAGYR